MKKVSLKFQGLQCRGSQLVDLKLVRVQGLISQVHQVAVVGKEDYLGLGGHLRQYSQGFCCALVVEVHQDVIHSEGEGLVTFQVMDQPSKTQGQKELIPGPVA